MGESGECNIMAEKSVRDKLDADVHEFIVIKTDTNMDRAMEIETINSLMGHNIEMNEHTNDGMNDMEGSSELFLDNSNSSKENSEDFYYQTVSSLPLDETEMKREWMHEESLISQSENNDTEIEENEERIIDAQAFGENPHAQEFVESTDAQEFDENPDEETIATFITSTGQQLALYAVEDSEEIFAVAVYSESGEPPTNFQFLMKSDVERLIGEGAVRTVKKPQQMRKQTYQGELMTTHDKELYLRSLENSSLPNQNKKTRQQSRQRDKVPNKCIIRSEVTPPLQEEMGNSSMDTQEEESEYRSINDELTYQDILDNSYFLLEHHPVKEIDSKLASNDVPKAQVESSVKQTSEDLAEKSTVQCILCDEDQSDSELTFEEIQKSLQYFDENKKTKALSKKSTAEEAVSDVLTNMQVLISSPPKREIESVQSPSKITSEIPARRVLQNSTVVKHKYVPNALLGRKNSNMESKKTVFIQGSTTLICCPASDIGELTEVNCKESQDFSSKIKRSRKQQLTIVNRADSEIIIQPASMVSEDEEERHTKKRGRRKKRRQNNFKNVMRTRSSFSKKISSSEQQSRIEVIEIDIDNDSETGRGDAEEKDGVKYGQRRNNIQEIITIEDGKEKGSSDKENEVIMVGDSDDDEDDTIEGKEDEVVVVEMQTKSNVAILKCDHCNRSFRQKRALDTHLRVCPKSPKARRRFTNTSRNSSTRSNESTRAVLKKQYVCKICQEKFDVVVALARHVRSHYKKNETVASVAVAARSKKNQGEADTTTIKVPAAIVADKNIIKTQSRLEQKSKEKLNVHRGWNSKKMSCVNCGRWFASVALLSNHSLQHGTKKSKKRMKQCQICKKLFYSRLLYIRHMRMHSNAKQLQKRIKRTLQSTSTNTTLRKRGRPRKL